MQAVSLTMMLAALSITTATGSAAGGATRGEKPAVRTSAEASPATTTLYGWGDDVEGQLGDGNTSSSTVPVAVSLPTGVNPVAVAANERDAYALGSNGKIYAWGDNSVGELGNGSTVPYSSTPVRVALPAGVAATAIVAGGATGYAIGSDGNLYAWGGNEYGVLGNGTTDDEGSFGVVNNNSSVPIEVDMPVDAVSVATGDTGGSYAIGSDGNLYGWGGGNSEYTYGPVTPQLVSIPSTIGPVSVAGNGSAPDLPLAPTYLLGSNGTVDDWGTNQSGELGNGTVSATTSPAPLTLPAGDTAQSIGAGVAPDVGVTGYAITTTKQLIAWGNNQYGQLGTGTATGPDSCPGYDFAVSCSTAPVAGLSGNETTAVASSGDTTYAISQPLSTPTGALVYSWGLGSSGQLGNGSTTGDSPTPVTISFPSAGTPTAIAAGDANGYALVATAPPTVSGSPPSPIAVGVPLSYGFTIGGMPTPTTTVATGTLPPGLTLAADGVLSGTPTKVGTYAVTVKASNGVSPKATDSFVMRVEAAPSITRVVFKGSSADPSIVVTGNGFGSTAPTPSYPPGPCPARGTGLLYESSFTFTDATGNWGAGSGGADGGGSCIGLVIDRWSTTKIVFGFGNDYPSNGLWVLNARDRYSIAVYNASASGKVKYP